MRKGDCVFHGDVTTLQCLQVLMRPFCRSICAGESLEQHGWALLGYLMAMD